jgi:hypothetical protein
MDRRLTESLTAIAVNNYWLAFKVGAIVPLTEKGVGAPI